MQVPGAGAERKPFLFIYVSFQMFDNATDLRLVTLKIKRADNATLTVYLYTKTTHNFHILWLLYSGRSIYQLPSSQVIKRTPYLLNALNRYMSVNLSGTAALMSQQSLNIPEISTRFQKMSRVTVP